MSLLKNLMVDTKNVWVEYPGLRGFELEIVNLGRDRLIQLRKDCMYDKINRKTRTPERILDEKKFVSEFTKQTIKNWKGLKLKYLEEILLVNLEGQDPESELPYSPEDAELLVSNSAEFDTWLNEAVFDLDNFRTKPDGGAVEASGSVAE